MDGITLDWQNYLAQTQAPISVLGFFISLIFTALTAYVVKRAYARFGQALSNRSNFGNIFVPLALTTMVIITIVKSSLALSLGLVGALSIVRFRAAIKEPEELVYLFICIAIGLGFGANQALITIVGVTVLVFVVAVIRRHADAPNSIHVMYLTISKASDVRLDLEKLIEVLEKNSLEIDLKRLDENTSMNEVSFMTSFANKTEFIQLRNDLFQLDSQLEVTFLDKTKVF
jgi:hypothetical protein